ncbi:MAG: hypothetical protein ACTSWW_10490 [Promethearchaeota archaeon]
MSLTHTKKIIKELEPLALESLELSDAIQHPPLSDQIDAPLDIFCNSMQNRLMSKGYDLPVVLLERSQQSYQDPWRLESFTLPTSKHDIYVESSFEEFHKIVSHLQGVEPIRFKLDYQSIWKGLTGTAL